MGVRGLKSFIENNDVLDQEFLLYDAPVVIDANNLAGSLYVQSQKHERPDLFGGDMVQFGDYVRNFFRNLHVCEVEITLVFDGAQTHDHSKDKTPEKHRRALERFQNVLSTSLTGFGDFILPATATSVLRSVAIDEGINVVQSMFEADLEIARLANETGSMVISNDSDFFLMGIEKGVIPIDSLNYELVRQSIDFEVKGPFYYIPCKRFSENSLIQSFVPDLDPRNLPLLGVIAGNDFIESKVFERICNLLPLNSFNSRRRFKRTSNPLHIKIMKILYFLNGKTLNESINQLCNLTARDRRQTLRQIVRSNLSVYNVPKKDGFVDELDRIYWPGFIRTNGHLMDREDLRFSFENWLADIDEWLKNAMQRSVLSYRCLELMHRNTIFIVSHLDDPNLPSAHLCLIRPMRVMLTLLRPDDQQSNWCTLYDRDGSNYSKKCIQPLKYLENYGNLRYTFFDIPTLDARTRKAILLSTFHFELNDYNRYILNMPDWLVGAQAKEFLIVKILLDYIDKENQQVRLWKQFKHATLLCMLYHIYSRKSRPFDAAYSSTENFLRNLSSLVKSRRFDKMPKLSRRKRYNCRLIHQITQLQSSIISYNWLNSFLGEELVRIRSELWLNSCLIYNLADALHYRTLRLENIPEVVFNYPIIQSVAEPIYCIGLAVAM